MIPYKIIEKKIYLIRGQKVMLDADLAKLYGVTTSNLKRQVRRNLDRFPNDFLFILSQKEIEMLVCQIGIPSKSHFGGAPPFAFTEHGILMLSSVLNSKRAIQVNIQIMRTFTRIREMLSSHKELREKIERMERKYDQQFKVVFDYIKALLEIPKKENKPIGFLKDRENQS